MNTDDGYMKTIHVPIIIKLMKMGSSSYPAPSSKAVTHSAKPLMRLLPVSRKLSGFALKIQSPDTSIHLQDSARSRSSRVRGASG